MVDIVFPDLSQTAGIPSQSTQNISATLSDFYTGDIGEVATEDLIVAASQTIPALSPVGYDANGRLVPAVAGSVAAIGIAVVAITTDASTSYKGLKVYRVGCFNPNRIAWPASYNTDALKLNAFHGAPSPTQIILRAAKQYTI